MKSTTLIMACVLALFTTTVFAQAEKADTFKVYGTCGMCERRIEKASNVDGVTMALWDVDNNNCFVSAG